MKIVVNNTELDFDGKIIINIYNQLFSKYNTYSFPFDIPLTHKNKKAFNFLSIINDTELDTVFDCHISSSIGTFLGRLKTKSINDKYIKCYFAGSNDFLTDLRALEMNDLELDMHTLSRVIGKNCCRARVHNPYMFKNTNILSHYSYVNRYINGRTPRIIFPQLSHILQKIFEHAGLKVNCPLFNDPDFKSIYYYHNNASNYPSFDHTRWIWTISDLDFYSGKVRLQLNHEVWDEILDVPEDYRWLYLEINNFDILDDKYVRYDIIDSESNIIELKSVTIRPSDLSDWSDGKATFVKRYSIAAHNVNYFDDGLKAWDFLKDIMTYFGLGLIVSNNDKEVSLEPFKYIYLSPAYSDLSKIAGNISSITFPDHEGIIMKAALDENDSLTNEKYKDIDPGKILAPVDTFDELPLSGEEEVGSLRLVKDERAFYRLERGYAYCFFQWKYYSSAIHIYIEEGDDKKEINTNISTLLMYNDETVGVKQPLNFQNYETKTSCKPRLFFCRAKNLDYNNINYYNCSKPGHHYSTNNVYDNAGNKVGNYGLHLSGEYSISETLLQGYFDMLNKINCKSKIKWTAENIAYLFFNKKIKIGNSFFLVKSISATIDHRDNISIGDTELQKI